MFQRDSGRQPIFAPAAAVLRCARRWDLPNGQCEKTGEDLLCIPLLETGNVLANRIIGL